MKIPSSHKHTKAKFRQAFAAEMLCFILLFTIFISAILTITINNKITEERSTVITFIEKEIAVLQSNLEGYSKYSEHCHMYDSGKKLSFSEATAKKNRLISLTENNIRNIFSEGSNKKTNSLYISNGNITIDIIDSNHSNKTAYIDTTIEYFSKSMLPFSKDNPMSANNKFRLKMKDNIKKPIQNPIREKNS